MGRAAASSRGLEPSSSAIAGRKIPLRQRSFGLRRGRGSVGPDMRTNEHNPSLVRPDLVRPSDHVRPAARMPSVLWPRRIKCFSFVSSSACSQRSRNLQAGGRIRQMLSVADITGEAADRMRWLRQVRQRTAGISPATYGVRFRRFRTDARAAADCRRHRRCPCKT